MWRRLGDWLGGLRPTVIWAISVGSLALVAASDFLTGPEFTLAIFYFVPVGLAAWYYGRRGGYVVAALSGLAVYIGDRLSPGMYTQPLATAWNAGVRLGYFLLAASLLSGLRRALERERELASTDALTGAANNRSFYQRASIEFDRHRRYRRPLTLVYIDIDDFKRLNDTLGHSAGDQALRAVADTLHANVRMTDLVARLGGDEFVLLLPETDTSAAQVVLEKLRPLLLGEMQRRGWQITFSIGVVTALPPPPPVDDLVRQADRLMYGAKQASKDQVQFGVWEALRSASS